MGGVDGELVVRVVLDQTRIDHLGHKVGSNFTRLVLLLQVHDLLLEFFDHCKLGLSVCLLFRSGLLIGLDLSQGTSALRAHLQHVGGHALRD